MERSVTLDRQSRVVPFLVAVCFLALFSVVFLGLRSRLQDGVFIIGNLLPLAFGALFGLRWGLAYALIHSSYAVALSGSVGFAYERLLSHGLPAQVITVILSGAIGRIRDLTASLRQHRAHLESLVQARTAELLWSNEQLKREIVERERAEAEKRSLEASLKRAEKMEAIGVLAGSVAHDLNNILGSLIGYPELLLLGIPEDSPMREAVVAIHQSGLRAAAVVQDLLTMARRGVTSSQVLDLNDVVAEVVRSPEILALRAGRPGVQIATELASGPLSVNGSAVHLSRAILNLILNAAEAIQDQGRIMVSTTHVYIDTPSSRYEVVAEGEYVALAVEDTGRGIARQDLERIFEPFYTKKVMGRSGTGLGLAIVWGTVKDHNGFIDVRSEPGQGTTFTLFLPTTREEPQAATREVTLEELLGHGESILVVDDVTLQRDLCVAMLRKLGYAVTAVPSGEEAVEYVRRQPVDLLVLDMIMEPGIDGLETYRRISAIRAGQKAVIASGFSESERVQEAQALGAGTYVRKPYTLERLGAVVKDELERRVAS